MKGHRSTGLTSVLAFGVVAFLVACLSILDMFLPRPFDGVILDPDQAALVVRGVVPGSGAAVAGIAANDRIIGVGRTIVRTGPEAAQALQSHRVGERLGYLLERDGRPLELEVELGPRRLGTPLYLYACILGFLFFLTGLYVLLSRPRAPASDPGHVFFVLSTLFLLFLVCRLRPASYSWVDEVVLTTGTLSLLALPAAFLHFFLLFPRRLTLHLVPPGDAGDAESPRLRRIERFLNSSPHLFTALYLLPPFLYAATLGAGPALGVPVRLVYGAPLASWVLMGDYLVLGLLALLASLLRSSEGRERRQIATVFAGTVLGVTPFLVLGVGFPSLFNTDRYVLLGVVPLALVPLTFAYAIVRFQFFEIKVIVRRSLLYTLTTAVVSVTYAVAIAIFNLIFRDVSVGRSPYFPLLLALAIVFLFDPLRRRLQVPVDRFFFREVYDARLAMEGASEAIARELAIDRLEVLLTSRLTEVMHLEWASLYVAQGEWFVTATGAPGTPAQIPASSAVIADLATQDRAVRLAVLEPLKALDPTARVVLAALAAAGARVLVPLRTRGRLHAFLALGGKRSEEEYGRDDLQLINTVANQAALAVENARLYQERTRQAELEKEMEIARRVQFSLIPSVLPEPPGWLVAAHCEPARQVGGDFYDALPGPEDGSVALVVGDVSGKSVPGALVMVAAREVLHTAALSGVSPERLLRLANARLYTPQRRMFVSLAYLLLGPGGRGWYALAGQPLPMVRRANGEVEELPFPNYRLPLGALREGAWDVMPFSLSRGETLLVYSDGLPDARNAAGDRFGEERIASLVGDFDGDAHGAVRAVREELARFAGGWEPYDDITVLSVSYRGELDA